jgi:hypothetical protein
MGILSKMWSAIAAFALSSTMAMPVVLPAQPMRLTPVVAAAPDAHAPAKDMKKSSAKDDKNDPDRIVCKKREVTGSRMPAGSVCRAQAEWDQIEADNHRIFEHGGNGVDPNQMSVPK